LRNHEKRQRSGKRDEKKKNRAGGRRKKKKKKGDRWPKDVLVGVNNIAGRSPRKTSEGGGSGEKHRRKKKGEGGCTERVKKLRKSPLRKQHYVVA